MISLQGLSFYAQNSVFKDLWVILAQNSVDFYARTYRSSGVNMYIIPFLIYG